MTAVIPPRIVYKAAAGAPFRRKDAPVIGSRIHRLAEAKGGALEPEDVVRDACDPSSPLHPLFEWEDDEAAELWRLHKARLVINHIKIIIVRDGEKEESRAFHNVTIHRGTENAQRGYVSARSVRDDPDLRLQVIEEALRHLNVWKARYAQYKELFPILEAIDQFQAARRTGSAAR